MCLVAHACTTVSMKFGLMCVMQLCPVVAVWMVPLIPSVPTQ